jgi:hypothetical protein
MSAPYPIVRVTDPQAREQLLRALLMAGFNRDCCTVYESVRDWPCINKYPYIYVQRFGCIYGSLDARYEPDKHLVNSSSAFLLYIKRNNLAPSA